MAALQETFSQTPGLRRVVYKQFLKSAMLPLFIVVAVLLSLYFWGTYYTSKTSLDGMETRAQDTLSGVTLAEARSLNFKLKEVSRNAASLQNIAEKLFTKPQPGQLALLLNTVQTSPAKNPLGILDLSGLGIHRSDNGVQYRDLQSMMYNGIENMQSLPSSIYVAANTELSAPLRQRLQLTEALDPHFQRIVDGNSTITSAYFNTWDNTNRYYPPLESIPGQFPPNMQIDKLNFYYKADATHNPKRSVVWTGAYLDPAGYGWMLSSIAPVYREGFLEGVVGIDITLSDFTANILSNNLIWGSSSVVVDEGGQILGISGVVQKLLELNTPKPGEMSTGPSKDYNLFAQKDFSQPGLAAFVAGKKDSVCCVDIKGQQYLLSQQVIAETGWRLILITPMANVNQQILEHERFLNKMGLYFLLLALAFMGMFFFYLKGQAIGLAEKVSKPIDRVADYISRLNKQGADKPLPAMMVGIRELDRLLSSGTEIQRARNQLSLLNEELAVKNEQLQSLATTDRLTCLPNRHKLDEVLAYEVARVKREENNLSVALLDIDHFKMVNDTFGHQVGDSILVGVAQIMRRNVRETDLIGRWGGEEFMILLPNTTTEQAAIVLNELRERISLADFHPVKQITISIGIADGKQFPAEAQVVEAADEALYKAKENGRNRVEQAGKQIEPALNLQ